MTRFAVDFVWQLAGPVTLRSDSEGVASLRFPDVLRPEPALYRLVIDPGGIAPEVYIGESSDVLGRTGQYRRGDASQRTSRWVHEHLHRRLDDGGTVRMDLVVEARFSVDGSPWLETDLHRKEHRLILENAALAMALTGEASDRPAVVLNRIADRATLPPA